MPTTRPIERLRVSTRSAVLAVAMLGAALTLLRLISSSQRVLGWILTAAVVAGLLHPLVSYLARRMPRGIAVAVVVLALAGVGGFVAYGAVGGLVRETQKLERAIPKRAAELERSKRFGAAAREFKLSERTRRFVNEVPARLRGGTPADALRSAATRGVAFLATGVLSIFFLLHGPRIARGAAEQIRDPARRALVERLALGAYRRGFGYARGSVAIAAVAGGLAYTVARLAHVPGPAPLALWVALWDLVPIVGTFLGALPIVLLAGVASTDRAVVVALVFIAHQVAEEFVLQQPLERRTVHVGPFLTVVGGFAGLELYGLGGALMVLLLGAVAAALADEWAPRRGAQPPAA
jgi:predicted PurR-regulated permease PerM